jgi:hypothetical protein
MRKCSGIKAEGTRCERLVGPSQEYCYSHDESRASERSRNASVAAKAKNAASELVQAKARLRELAEAVVEGEVTTARGSVAAQLYGVYLRAIEQERRQKELEEFEERLASLEEAQGPRGGGYGWQA